MHVLKNVSCANSRYVLLNINFSKHNKLCEQELLCHQEKGLFEQRKRILTLTRF